MIGIIICSAVGNSIIGRQSSDHAFEKWKGDSDDTFTQVSCFFSDDADFKKDRVNSVRASLTEKLVNAAYETEEGKKLFADAYNAALGRNNVKCNVSRWSEAEITSVHGDFFIFHDFGLLNGAYFLESDLIQDGAVIDRKLAWELYGSDDIAGMNIYINGVKCRVSGI